MKMVVLVELETDNKQMVEGMRAGLQVFAQDCSGYYAEFGTDDDDMDSVRQVVVDHILTRIMGGVAN